MGRPRKPTAQLHLHGGYRPDRHASRSAEPQPDGVPEKPTDLPKYALEHWDRVVPGLVATGVAKACDGPALLMLCHWWHELQTLRKQRKKDDQQRLQLMAKCQRNWNDLAFRFGMTPVDRSRLTVDRADNDDPTAKYLA